MQALNLITTHADLITTHADLFTTRADLFTTSADPTTTRADVMAQPQTWGLEVVNRQADPATDNLIQDVIAAPGTGAEQHGAHPQGRKPQL